MPVKKNSRPKRTAKTKTKRKPAKKKTRSRRGSPAAVAPDSATTARIDITKPTDSPWNPRVELRPDDAAWQKIDRSIDEFGYVGGIVVNKRSGNLVGGHQRRRVMVARGVTHADVNVVDLSPAAEKQLCLALNRITGAWDDSALAVVLADLQADADTDELLTGFDAAEIEKLLADDDPPGDTPAAPVVEPETFGLLVLCTDANHRETTRKELTELGFACQFVD